MPASRVCRKLASPLPPSPPSLFSRRHCWWSGQMRFTMRLALPVVTALLSVTRHCAGVRAAVRLLPTLNRKPLGHTAWPRRLAEGARAQLGWFYEATFEQFNRWYNRALQYYPAPNRPSVHFSCPVCDIFPHIQRGGILWMKNGEESQLTSRSVFPANSTTWRIAGVFRSG